MIWVLIALLVGWGNIGSSLLAPTAILPGGSWAFVLAGVMLTTVALLFARRGGLDLAGLGLRSPDRWRGAAIGLGAGTAIALGAVLFTQLAAIVVGGPVVYDPLRDVTAPDLARHLFVFLPIGTVLPEEIAFRGTLVGLLRKGSLRRAMLGSAAAFALWHAAVAVVTVNATTLAASVWVLPAIVGALAVVFAGGIVLAWLRLVTDTLASTLAAHWAFNATLLVGLWTLLPAPVPEA